MALFPKNTVDQGHVSGLAQSERICPTREKRETEETGPADRRQRFSEYTGRAHGEGDRT